MVIEKSNSVLIIDDDPQAVQLCQLLLKERLPDLVIKTALGGTTGIRLAKQYKPDIVLLDLMMPKLDGFEVCKIIKSDEIMKDICIVIVSALDVEDCRITCFGYGAICYIIKPYNVDELVSVILNTLRGKRLGLYNK
jgi:two-component system sensor histidine kinase/response regulator